MGDFLKDLWVAFNEDQVPFLAAAVSYFAFFSLFPLFLGLIAVAGHVLAPEEASRRLMGFIVQGFPGQEVFLRRIIESVVASRGAVGFFALITLLWSGKNLFVSLAQALDLIEKAPAPGGLYFTIKRNLVCLACAVALGGLLLLLGGLYGLLFAVLAFEIPLLGIQPREIPLLMPFVSDVLPVALVALGLIALYRWLPAHPRPLGDVIAGAAVAAALWEVLRRLFTWYVATFGRFNEVYGPATSVIVFLFWLYLSAIVFLLGGEWAAVRGRRSGGSAAGSS
jgi:membrane protein